MDQFSIKQVEQLSGIKAHTLRIWEKRYGLIVPGRSDGKQRMYSNEDLRSILRVVYLYNQGLKISKIADLDEETIVEKINSDTNENMSSRDLLFPRLLEACIDLDEPAFDLILSQAANAFDFESLMLTVIYPFLELIGNAWVSARIMPNNEHFVSNLVTRRIIAATEKLRHRGKKPPGKKILLFQPEGECHEIPLLFINYLFLKYGFRTYYFGSNTSINTLKMFCEAQEVDCMYLHELTNLKDFSMNDYLADLCDQFSSKKILASGPGIGVITDRPSNLRIFRSGEQLLTAIRNKNFEIKSGRLQAAG